MPSLTINGTTLHYESTGTGDAPILFLHGLLYSGEMYRAQVKAFSPRHRCVTLDFRGQGRSAVARAGYDMETLTRDVVAVIDALDLGAVHLAGLSMGGFVAMRVAARRPKLVRSLILLETSAEPEPREKIGRYRLLGLIGRYLGFGLVAGSVMPIMFGKAFLRDRERAAERAEWRARIVANDRLGVPRALEGVVTRLGVESELANVTAPTLVIVGDDDVATPVAKARRIHELIAGSTLVVLPRAGHSSTIEEPAAVNAAIASFLAVAG